MSDKRPIGRRRWTSVLVAVVVLVLVFVGYRTWYNRTPHAVKPTDLSTSGGLWSRVSAWRDLPFDLTPPEEADVKRCVELAKTTNLEDNARVELEKLLASRPGFFYAEWVLGYWYEMHGNAAKASALKQHALEMAPVVLIQTYRYANGRPLVGATIQLLEIEHNRVKKGSLDPSLNLAFHNLRTDVNGQIKVPVYDTVYRVGGISYPTGVANCAYPSLGWFTAPSHLALLPDATVTQPAK